MAYKKTFLEYIPKILVKKSSYMQLNIHIDVFEGVLLLQ